MSKVKTRAVVRWIDVTALQQALLGSVLPHYASVQRHSAKSSESLHSLLSAACRTLHQKRPPPLSIISDCKRLISLDIEAILNGDPAARSRDEVILAYPGFLAIATHRFSHELWKAGYFLLARMLSESAHSRTGVDIHPGATIGAGLCIDHGTGIVIGETTTIGANVKLYQGVTLGAISVSKALAHKKRHPTLEDNVTVYANATILGGSTVIGHDSIIGGSVWLTQSVPPGSTVFLESERHTIARRRK